MLFLHNLLVNRSRSRQNPAIVFYFLYLYFGEVPKVENLSTSSFLSKNDNDTTLTSRFMNKLLNIQSSSVLDNVFI